MKEYERLEMEVVILESEDVITESELDLEEIS